jgi:hypothetical protein
MWAWLTGKGSSPSPLITSHTSFELQSLRKCFQEHQAGKNAIHTCLIALLFVHLFCLCALYCTRSTARKAVNLCCFLLGLDQDSFLALCGLPFVEWHNKALPTALFQTVARSRTNRVSLEDVRIAQLRRGVNRNPSC